MNILDENVPLDQCDLLRTRGIPCRLMGREVAETSIGDDNIVSLLHRLKDPTFFTRDEHFFKPRLCHENYCLVWLDVAPEEAALFVQRFLRHARFDSRAKRFGLVARAHHDGVHFWQRNRAALQQVGWTEG